MIAPSRIAHGIASADRDTLATLLSLFEESFEQYIRFYKQNPDRLTINFALQCLENSGFDDLAKQLRNRI